MNIAGLIAPNSIFYPPYVLSALALALVWLVFGAGLGWREGLRMLGDRKVWVARSTRVDLAFCVFYVTVLRVAVAAVESAAFLASLGVCSESLGWLTARLFPSGWDLAAPRPLAAALATLMTMVAIDGASYGVHRLMHRIGALWRIHAVHHGAEQLTPLTTYRQHPLEPLLLNGARGAAAGLALAVVHTILPQRTPVATVFGLGAGFFVYMFTVNLHHAPVPVRYPRWLRWMLISPHIHHLHHSASASHHGKNYGVVLSLWDRLLGTYYEQDVGLGELRFGLGEARPVRRDRFTSRRRHPGSASEAAPVEARAA
jgi:sterol desaturase/sphingolipid hydroxylase (fatty acid hydroxylase superfamily)